jgi:hypothetical protein
MTSGDLSSRIRAIVAREEPRLRGIAPAAASRAAQTGKWSPSEVLGHLVDSASNNHQRFVRTQLQEGFLSPGYQQDEWVSAQAYAAEPWADLVALWAALNTHLAHVVRHMPPAAMGRFCTIVSPGGERNPPVTLEALVEDYIRHLEHHLEQIKTG